VSIAVRNRGVIAGERLDGIFNPLKGSTTPRTSSSSASTGNLGLGLYIAERIVVAHCGRIGVESSEAEGTTFTVHLPRNV
jgi:signal transduction histidine kinase